jgi:hypothetical protein
VRHLCLPPEVEAEEEEDLRLLTVDWEDSHIV